MGEIMLTESFEQSLLEKGMIYEIFIKAQLRKAFLAVGYEMRSVYLARVHEVEAEIMEQKRAGLISHDFYDKALSGFDFNIEENQPNAKSLLIIAAPDQTDYIEFNLTEWTQPLKLPATYHTKNQIDTIKSIFQTFEKNYGIEFRYASLPHKLLAVRSGLAKYGRNNVTYSETFGSFQYLTTFSINLALEEDDWLEAKLMTACTSCNQCVQACPTKALSEARFTIDAEKCITYFNEYPGAFPIWVAKEWHNAILGCNLCTESCPVNKPYIDSGAIIESFDFSESQLILSGKPYNQLPSTIQMKLNNCSLTSSYPLLSRNISVLL